jgi:hypothetical protein
MARLQRLGTAILTQIGPMSYTDLIGLYDAQVVDGRHYALRTRWLADLTPDIISALVAAGTARTSPLSSICGSVLAPIARFLHRLVPKRR